MSQPGYSRPYVYTLFKNNEEVHSLYPSHNIVAMMKFRRLRWAGHVARMRENCNR